MSLPLNCTLLCASGAAYNIDPQGKYHPDPIFSKNVQYQGDPIPISKESDDSFCFPNKPKAKNAGPDKINACLVGQTSAGVIASFRGTLVMSLDDIIQDLLAEPVKSQGLPGKVHCGFQVAVQSMIDEVEAAVRSFRPSTSNPVLVTGHSKGGGMASLAAYLLRKRGMPVKQVMTFAAPKSGNSAFATAYSLLMKNHVRYENYGDIVPLLPPADEFIKWVAWAVSLVSPELGQLICEAAGWDYTAVGSKLYIESDHSISTHEPEDFQILDLGAYYLSNVGNLETAIGNAHTLACKYGYMSGACPSTICTATSPAEPEVVELPEKVSV